LQKPEVTTSRSLLSIELIPFTLTTSKERIRPHCASRVKVTSAVKFSTGLPARPEEKSAAHLSVQRQAPNSSAAQVRIHIRPVSTFTCAVALITPVLAAALAGSRVIFAISIETSQCSPESQLPFRFWSQMWPSEPKPTPPHGTGTPIGLATPAWVSRSAQLELM